MLVKVDISKQAATQVKQLAEKAGMKTSRFLAAVLAVGFQALEDGAYEFGAGGVVRTVAPGLAPGDEVRAAPQAPEAVA